MTSSSEKMTGRDEMTLGLTLLLEMQDGAEHDISDIGAGNHPRLGTLTTFIVDWL